MVASKQKVLNFDIFVTETCVAFVKGQAGYLLILLNTTSEMIVLSIYESFANPKPDYFYPTNRKTLAVVFSSG